MMGMQYQMINIIYVVSVIWSMIVMNKIQYWEFKLNEAKYYIKRYKQELKKEIEKNG